MSEMSPAFQFYPRDFIMSTHGMTDEQVGAYIRLLSFAWDRCGLPANEREIQELGYWTDEAWARIWPKVGPKWKRRGDRLINERQERERSAQKVRAEAAREAGKRGAKVRWNQLDTKPDHSHPTSHPNAEAMRIDSTASAFACTSVVKDQRQTTAEPSSVVVATPVETDLTAYSPGQIRAGVGGLVGAWNSIVASVLPAVAVSPGASSANISRALAAHPDINWWGDVFKAVVASDYLTGRDGQHPPITFWKAVDKAEEIHSGRYANRPAAKVAKPAERQGVGQPRYRTIADEIGTPEYQKFLELSKNDYKREAH